VLPFDEFRVPVDGRAEMRCRVRGVCGIVNDDKEIGLVGQLPKLMLQFFLAPLDWSQLPACQILMRSKWNDMFGLVLDFVWVASKVRETKQ
jgi:hypothetical protein